MGWQRTVTGKTPTKSKQPGMTLTGKKIPGMGSKSFPRYFDTMSRPPLQMVSCKNETTKHTLRSHCSKQWWLPTRRKTPVDGRGHKRDSERTESLEIVDTVQRTHTGHSQVKQTQKARTKDIMWQQRKKDHKQRRQKNGQETRQVNIWNEESIPERARAAVALNLSACRGLYHTSESGTLKTWTKLLRDL